jgi:hypothetical protein
LPCLYLFNIAGKDKDGLHKSEELPPHL